MRQHTNTTDNASLPLQSHTRHKHAHKYVERTHNSMNNRIYSLNHCFFSEPFIPRSHALSLSASLALVGFFKWSSARLFLGLNFCIVHSRCAVTDRNSALYILNGKQKQRQLPFLNTHKRARTWSHSQIFSMSWRCSCISTLISDFK